MIIIPAVLYEIFHFLAPDIAISILLLCAMPPGVAAPALTDIAKGNTSLSLAISLIAYLM